jgi:uncharacterized damage-inducible protein DinB
MTVATFAQLESYSSIPTRVAHAIEGLSETQWYHTPTEGEWNIHEVVIHLADSEVVGFWRVRKTLAEQDSLLAVYRQQDPALALRLFTDLRTSTAALLKLIPNDAWERTSIHAERGKMTVYDIFQIYLEHGENHLRQIETIKHTFPI